MTVANDGGGGGDGGGGDGGGGDGGGGDGGGGDGGGGGILVVVSGGDCPCILDVCVLLRGLAKNLCSTKWSADVECLLVPPDC